MASVQRIHPEFQGKVEATEQPHEEIQTPFWTLSRPMTATQRQVFEWLVLEGKSRDSICRLMNWETGTFYQFISRMGLRMGDLTQYGRAKYAQEWMKATISYTVSTSGVVKVDPKTGLGTIKTKTTLTVKTKVTTNRTGNNDHTVRRVKKMLEGGLDQKFITLVLGLDAETVKLICERAMQK